MQDPATAESCQKLDWSIVQQTLKRFVRRITVPPMFGSIDTGANRNQRQSNGTTLYLVQTIDEAGGHLPIGAVKSAGEVLQKCQDRNVLDLDDLKDMRDLLEGLKTFREDAFVWAEGRPLLSRIVNQGEFPHFLSQQLSDSFELDGSLSERTYPKLSLLRNRIQEFKSKLEFELNRLLNDPSVTKMLQESFVTQRNGRHVLPLKSNFRRQFGIVHGRSQSGETLFVEPLSVIPIANGLTEAEMSLEQEIHHICRELSHRIFRSQNDILVLLASVAQVDAATAAFKLGQKWTGVIPKVESAGTLMLNHARHPVWHFRVFGCSDCLPLV